MPIKKVTLAFFEGLRLKPC